MLWLAKEGRVGQATPLLESQKATDIYNKQTNKKSSIISLSSTFINLADMRYLLVCGRTSHQDFTIADNEIDVLLVATAQI